MLRLIAEPIIVLTNAIFGSGRKRYLISALFKKEKRHKLNEPVLSHIKHRKATKLKLCNWLCDRRNKRLHKQAENRVAKELDIINFLKHQLIDSITRRLLFSKLERHLIQH